MLYDELLAQADFGTLITYDDLDRVLGRPFRPERGPIYRARQHLGEMRQRWLAPVANVGYRVIDANEHLNVAQQHKRKAKHQFGLMVKVAEVTDVSRLTPEELVAFDSQAKVNAMLYLVAVHHERRIQRIEQVLREDGRL